MTLLLLALACATDPTTPAPTALEVATSGAARPAVDVPTVPTMLGDTPGVAFLGDWTSAPCEGRAFSRNLRFE